MTNIILSIWFQNSRFKAQKNFCNPTSLDSRFKIQGSEKTSSIQPLRIQDSRSKIQGSEKTSTIQPVWIQDSRFKAQKNFFNPTSLDSRFKIQGSEKTSSIQPLWIQVSRSKIQGSEKTSTIQHVWIQDSRLKAQKKLYQSNLFGFKIQDSRLRKNFFNPTCLDSRFKIQGSEKTFSIQPVWTQDLRFKTQKKLLQSNLFGFKIQGWRPSDSFFFWNLESWILVLAPWVQEVFSEPWLLNVESYPLGFKKFFLSLESWILDPTPLDSRILFGILNPSSLDSRSFFWALTLESWILPPWIQEFFLESWILNP